MTEEKRSVALVASSQAEMPLIVREVDNRIVQQRATDGYINATAMCKAAGRPWNRYWDTGPTQRFIQALSADTVYRYRNWHNDLRAATPNFRALGSIHRLPSTWLSGCLPILLFKSQNRYLSG